MILSINDTSLIRSLFAEFQIEDVRLNYSLAKAGSKRAAELIISNQEDASVLI